MKVVPIDLSLIDFEDKTFYTGNIGNLSSLKDSIKELGVLNPPILRENGGNYQIVTGWKRLISCKEMGHKELMCNIYPSNFSDRDFLKVIFLDNKDRISDLEVAELVMLHRKLCSLDDQQLMDEVLPTYEVPSNRKYLDKYLALASIEEDIKSAFYEGKVTIEQCQMLSELPIENRLPILNEVLLKYKLNNNESRQVIQHISELTSIKLRPILDVINELETNILDDKIDKNAFRDKLKRMRYPDLAQVEEKVKNTIKDLDLPKGVNLVINQFFEANDIELRIKAKSSEEILKICSDLESLSNNGDIDKLISLIKGGNNGIE